MGGYAIPPEVVRSNPELQRRLAMSAMPDQMSTQPQMSPAMQQPQEIPASVSSPTVIQRLGQAPMPKPMATVKPVQAPTPSPAELSHQTEYNRLTGAGPNPQEGKSGISQIHNPVGRTLLTALDAIGSGLFPRIAANIPGTEAHHEQLVGQTGAALGQEQKNRKDTSLEQEEAARAADLATHPELAQAKNELAQNKLSEETRAHQATEDINRVKNTGQHNAALAQHGFKEDQTGQIVPLDYNEMSEPQQAVHDLKAAQAEQAEATAALRKAQAENAPAMAKLAQQRLQSSQVAHDIALRRLGLSEMQTEGRLFGTNKGQALPGSILTDEGTPVGSAFQQNVRPTGTERNKADLANSAHEQLQDIKSIVAKRPDIFGPAAGRKTDFTVWVGSQDPDAQAFRAARTIAGDHLAGVFGGRSEAALQALDSAIGHFKDNPAALQAGLDQLDKANRSFQKAGTPRTTGSNAANAEKADPAVKAYADKYFGGDVKKAQSAIDSQKKK